MGWGGVYVCYMQNLTTTTRRTASLSRRIYRVGKGKVNNDILVEYCDLFSTNYEPNAYRGITNKALLTDLLMFTANQ